MRPLALPLLETPAVSAKLSALAGQYKRVVLREVLGMEDGAIDRLFQLAFVADWSKVSALAIHALPSAVCRGS